MTTLLSAVVLRGNANALHGGWQAGFRAEISGATLAGYSSHQLTNIAKRAPMGDRSDVHKTPAQRVVRGA